MRCHFSTLHFHLQCLIQKILVPEKCLRKSLTTLSDWNPLGKELSHINFETKVYATTN